MVDMVVIKRLVREIFLVFFLFEFSGVGCGCFWGCGCFFDWGICCCVFGSSVVVIVLVCLGWEIGFVW